jgi:translation initiation factor IF-2
MPGAPELDYSLEEESDRTIFSGYSQQSKSHELLSSIKINSPEDVSSIDKIKTLLMLSDEQSKEIFHFVVSEAGLEKHLKQVALKKCPLSLDLVNIVASTFSCKFVEDQRILKRKPVICVMGHVDHGKTTLLDYYRNTRKAAGEVGGITQKIGGFTMATRYGEVSFIDTPGHSLFSNMRQTGAFLADLGILIISAVEGVQPQTLEVLQLIKENGLPFVVAINKIDAMGAEPERVEEQLMEIGVEVEEYGGKIPSVHISAKTGQNVDLLLELLVEETNKLKLVGDYQGKPECLVLETAVSTSEMKKTSIVVKNGQVKPGNHLFYSNSHFKVIKINDDLGRPMEFAGPGDICEVYGLHELPSTIERILGTSSEPLARLATELNKRVKEKFFAEEVETFQNDFKVELKNRRERNQFRGSADFRKVKLMESLANIQHQIKEIAEKETSMTDEDRAKEEAGKKFMEKSGPTMDLLNQQNRSLNFILNEMSDTELENPVLIKVSNMGTRDTIQTYLDRLENKKFTVVDITCGQITEHDVLTARQLKAKIVVFDLPSNQEAEKMVREAGIDLVFHNIIYRLFDEMQSWKSREEVQATAKTTHKSRATIKRIFDSKGQQIAGIKVEEGILRKVHNFRLVRKGRVVANNLKVSGMKHLKDEVDTLDPKMEGGLTFTNPPQFVEGDVLEAY